MDDNDKSNQTKQQIVDEWDKETTKIKERREREKAQTQNKKA